MPLRIRLFSALTGPVMRRTRSRRMAAFARDLGIAPGMKVIDLGGTTYNWQWLDTPLDITIVNLPGIRVEEADSTVHRFRFVQGDATRLEQFADGSFDIAFANSVIEHVGGPDRQAALAGEVKRLGRGYFVQTGSRYFPIEPHCGLPFWWYYPPALKAWFFARWARSVPDWGEMVAGTTVLSLATLRRLFPDARARTEWFGGFPKSYVLYKSARPA